MRDDTHLISAVAIRFATAKWAGKWRKRKESVFVFVRGCDGKMIQDPEILFHFNDFCHPILSAQKVDE